MGRLSYRWRVGFTFRPQYDAFSYQVNYKPQPLQQFVADHRSVRRDYVGVKRYALECTTRAIKW